jgi:hypothetical protein
MMPASAATAATAIVKAVEDTSEGRVGRREPSKFDRFAHGRAFAWMVAFVVVAAAVAGTGVRVAAESDRVEGLQAELATARSALAAASESGTDTAALQAQVVELRQRLAELRDAKTRTVVEEKTVTETITKWVPSGDEVAVEVTGFDGQVELQDVQISHAYGFSDLIGIAVNTSGETISYAQLGCTFVDEEGRVVANAIDNKQNWLPDQTWGFSCSAQVRATGGILRVDEAA